MSYTPAASSQLCLVETYNSFYYFYYYYCYYSPYLKAAKSAPSILAATLVVEESSIHNDKGLPLLARILEE
jgi:hypothetical protein